MGGSNGALTSPHLTRINGKETGPPGFTLSQDLSSENSGWSWQHSLNRASSTWALSVTMDPASGSQPRSRRKNTRHGAAIREEPSMPMVDGVSH